MADTDLTVCTYQDVQDALGNGRAHLLLGNGFSIGCDPIFRYPSLFDAAVAAGLSPRARAVFDRLGTNNFEGVMRLLDDAHWVARTYGLIASDESEMLADVDVVKRTLLEAIARSHLAHAGEVPTVRKRAALQFLSSFHNIFTTNYDLVLYWVIMSADGTPVFRDGFSVDKEYPEAEYLVFSERLGSQRGLFYIHGALHLYVELGELRKHSWIRSGDRLTELVKKGLAERQYPLFVAEGSSEKKREQIQSNGYLWYCLDKLARIEGPLVIYGHSLGPSDRHIADVIAGNRKMGLLFVGVRGDMTSERNLQIRATLGQIQEKRNALLTTTRGGRELTVTFFDASSTRVWEPIGSEGS